MLSRLASPLSPQIESELCNRLAESATAANSIQR
jgi:hypothetical protein